MTKKKILALIQTYNDSELLKDAVDSLMGQTLKPTRVIVVDDGTPNNTVLDEYKLLSETYPNLGYFKGSFKPKPDLDTVSLSIMKAWSNSCYTTDYDYVSIFDTDSRPEKDYFRRIVNLMIDNPKLVCASGAIMPLEGDKVEKINIGANVGRKDARGSGKLIDINFIGKIAYYKFPEIAWDTWINTRAKVEGYKAKQIDDVLLYTTRSTKRVKGKDQFRSGRLTYHFGYNPLLVVMKTVLAKKQAITFLKGYNNARKNKWKLPDKQVRQFFGWRFIFHPFK